MKKKYLFFIVVIIFFSCKVNAEMPSLELVLEKNTLQSEAYIIGESIILEGYNYETQKCEIISRNINNEITGRKEYEFYDEQYRSCKEKYRIWNQNIYEFDYSGKISLLNPSSLKVERELDVEDVFYYNIDKGLIIIEDNKFYLLDERFEEKYSIDFEIENVSYYYLFGNYFYIFDTKSWKAIKIDINEGRIVKESDISPKKVEGEYLSMNNDYIQIYDIDYIGGDFIYTRENYDLDFNYIGEVSERLQHTFRNLYESFDGNSQYDIDEEIDYENIFEYIYENIDNYIDFENNTFTGIYSDLNFYYVPYSNEGNHLSLIMIKKDFSEHSIVPSINSNLHDTFSYIKGMKKINNKLVVLLNYGGGKCPESNIPYVGDDCDTNVIIQIYNMNYKVETKTDGNGKIEYTMEDGMVRFSLVPREGYVLGSVKVIDENGNVIEFNDYTFTMPSSNVLIEANFMMNNPFTGADSSFIIISGIISFAILILFYFWRRRLYKI